MTVAANCPDAVGSVFDVRLGGLNAGDDGHEEDDEEEGHQEGAEEDDCDDVSHGSIIPSQPPEVVRRWLPCRTMSFLTTKANPPIC